MAKTYQKPLSKCQAEKNAITSKQITSDKGEKQIERGKFNSHKNPTMLQVFISAKNWATYTMYFHQQETSSKFKYSDDATQESQTRRNRNYSTV